MAKVALCLWLHQPSRATGLADHDNHDDDDGGKCNGKERKTKQ